MARLFVLVTVTFFVAVAAAETQPSYFYPVNHNTEVKPLLIQDLPQTAYEYQIIPADGYAVAEYNEGISIWDIVTLPITAVSTVISGALSLTKWIIFNSGFVLLGIALVIGFCAFTPYCTLTIEKPFSKEIRSLNFPYLEELENYLTEAYNKYEALQDDEDLFSD